jgi:AmiR/NasT family two-component response regulator
MVQQPGLALMRVCIFSSENELCDILSVESKGAGYNIEQKFNAPQKLLEFISRSNTDYIVLIDIRRPHEYLVELISELCASRPLAIVALVNSGGSLGRRAMEAGAQVFLHDPVSAKDICVGFSVAAFQHSKQARLDSEIRQLKEKLAERKLIEKAKGILMDAASVSEDEAFRLIQRQSQEKRKPMAEIATSIISTTQLVQEASRVRER